MLVLLTLCSRDDEAELTRAQKWVWEKPSVAWHVF
jgi:hypothetical protein